MPRGAFDVQAFFAALDAARRDGQKSWKQVAGEARVSASTLTRLAQGHRADVDSLASLLAWSGLTAEAFIRGRGATTRAEPPTVARISAILRADPKLSVESAAALERIIEAAYQQMSRSSEAAPSRVPDRGPRDRA